MKCPHCGSKKVDKLHVVDYWKCVSCGKCSSYDDKKGCDSCGEYPAIHPEPCGRCGEELYYECAGYGPHYNCSNCGSERWGKKFLKAALKVAVQ